MGLFEIDNRGKENYAVFITFAQVCAVFLRSRPTSDILAEIEPGSASLSANRRGAGSGVARTW